MGTKFTQLKTDLSQNNWLVFVVFLMYNFHLSFAVLYYFVERRKNYLISSLNWFLRVFFTFMVSCFVNVIRYGKRMKILLYSVLFCLLKSKINPFLRIQFSQLLSRGKGKNIISCFLPS